MVDITARGDEFRKATSALHARYANALERSNKQHMLALLFPGLHDAFGGFSGPVGNPVPISAQTAGNGWGGGNAHGVASYAGTRGSEYYDPKELQAIFCGENLRGRSDVWNTFNNAQISALTPYVQFWTINVDDAGNKNFVSIPLQNMQPEARKGGTAYASNSVFGFLGLKDVDVEMSGRFEETKFSDINVRVQFAANSLHVLADPRYRQLVIPSSAGNQLGVGSRLHMQFGWSALNPPTVTALEYTEQQKTLVNSQVANYELFYTKHDFSLDQDGSFTLTVNYVAKSSNVLKEMDLSFGETFGLTGGSEQYVTLLEDVYPSARTSVPRTEEQLSIIVDEYIRKHHPSINEEGSALIYSHFLEIFVGARRGPQGLRAVRQAMTSAQESIQKINIKSLQSITAVLRQDGLEYATAIPTLNRRVKLMKCASYSVFFDDVVNSYPYTGGTPAQQESFIRDMMAQYYDASNFIQNDHGVGRFEMAQITNMANSPGSDFVNEDNIFKPIGNLSTTSPQFANGTLQSVFSSINANAASQEILTKMNWGGTWSSGAAKRVIRVRSRDRNLGTPARVVVPPVPPPATSVRFNKSYNNYFESIGPAGNWPESLLTQPNYWYPITFYRLGDLLDAFVHIGGARSKMERENITLLLGSCLVRNRYYSTAFGSHAYRAAVIGTRHPNRFYSKSYPLYDILIERGEYIGMLNDRFVDRPNSTVTFASFLEGLLDIVRKYYATGDAVFESRAVNSSRMFTMDNITTRTTSNSGQPGTRGFHVAQRHTARPQSLRVSLPPRTPSTIETINQNTSTIYLLNVGSTTSQEAINQARDAPTYRVGAQRSVVKRVKFNRVTTNVQRATESDNIEAVATTKEGSIIPQLFDLDLEIFGNVHIAPGYQFNLIPFAPRVPGVGTTTPRQVLEQLGLVNVNMAIKVNHKINPQVGFITRISSIAVGPSSAT